MDLLQEDEGHYSLKPSFTNILQSQPNHDHHYLHHNHTSLTTTHLIFTANRQFNPPSNLLVLACFDLPSPHQFNARHARAPSPFFVWHLIYPSSILMPD